MNQQNLIISFLVVCTLTIGSCAKDKYEDPCSDNSLIRSVKSGNIDNEQLVYNGNCQVYEYIQEFMYKKYIYNDQNQLKKVEIVVSTNPASCFMQPGATGEVFTDPRKAKPGQNYTFEYDASGNRIKKSVFFLRDGTMQLTSYQTYEYQNNLISAIHIFNTQDQLMQKYVYIYENGNVSQEKYYSVENGTTEKLLRVHSYKYDDRLNPYKVLVSEGQPGIYTNNNNILSDSVKHFYNDVVNEYVTNYTYEYNTSGFPSKVNNMSYIYGK
jgi:hypothetical protein